MRRALPGVIDAGWTAELITGGLSNLTYRLRSGAGTTILRRPPLGGVLASAHDMAREYRTLEGLAGTAVPVPGPLAVCTDPAVLGAPFYLMQDVPGRVLRTSADVATLPTELRARVSGELAGVLADLHAVDPTAAGPGRTGPRTPHGPAAGPAVGCPVGRVPHQGPPDMDALIGAVAERTAQLPVTRDVLVHGDYRLDNVIIGPAAADGAGGTSPAGRLISAVVDWELSTVGDPLSDLALTMTYRDLASDGGPSQLTGGAWGAPASPPPTISPKCTRGAPGPIWPRCRSTWRWRR